jgi:hypothetical protein
MTLDDAMLAAAQDDTAAATREPSPAAAITLERIGATGPLRGAPWTELTSRGVSAARADRGLADAIRELPDAAGGDTD